MKPELEIGLTIYDGTGVALAPPPPAGANELVDTEGSPNFMVDTEGSPNELTDT